MNLSMKQKHTHRHRQQTGCQMEGSGGGIEWDVWVTKCKILHRMNKQRGPSIQHRELYSIS